MTAWWAVFHTERDSKGRITVKLPDGNTGKLFLPDTDTPEGLRQSAQAVLDKETRELPKHVRQALAWLMEALDARVSVHGTQQEKEPVISVQIGSAQDHNAFHSMSMAGGTTKNPSATSGA